MFLAGWQHENSVRLDYQTVPKVMKKASKKLSDTHMAGMTYIQESYQTEVS